MSREEKSKLSKRKSSLWPSCTRSSLCNGLSNKSLVNLPQPYTITKLYYMATNIFHIVNVVLNIMALLKLGKGNDSRICLMPRFVVYEVFGREHMNWLSLIFSMHMLCWRIVITFIERDISFDLLLYLCLDESTIRCAELSINQSECTPTNITIINKLPEFVRNILFYHVVYKTSNRVEFRQKPNRTLASKSILLKKLDFIFKVGMLAVLFTSIGIAPSVIIDVLYKENDIIYRNCYSIYHPVLIWNRMLISIIMSVVIFFDGCLNCFGVISLMMYLICDLLIYWEEIGNRLKKLTHFMPIYRTLIESKAASSTTNTTEHLNRSVMFTYKRKLQQAYGSSMMQDTVWKDSFEREVAETQAMIGDFFNQLGYVDKYVSVVNVMAFFIWLSYNGSLYYTKLELDTYLANTFVHAFQLLAFVTIFSYSCMILIIVHKTEPSYAIISSLMALDPSYDKNKWIILVKYYTVRARYAFTIFHSELYTQLMFLKIVSYTFSVNYIIENVRNYTNRQSNWLI